MLYIFVNDTLSPIKIQIILLSVVVQKLNYNIFFLKISNNEYVIKCFIF